MLLKYLQSKKKFSDAYIGLAHYLAEIYKYDQKLATS